MTATDDNGGATTRSVSISLSAKSLKQFALDQLRALLATATRRDDIAHLNDAIKKLTSSLTPSRWIDGNHLQAKTGKKVFEDEAEAVDALGELLKNGHTGVSTAGIPAIIAGLVQADALLASTAITDATNSHGDSRKLAEAQRDAKAQSLAARGKAEEAIDAYGRCVERGAGVAAGP